MCKTGCLLSFKFLSFFYNSLKESSFFKFQFKNMDYYLSPNAIDEGLDGIRKEYQRVVQLY